MYIFMYTIYASVALVHACFLCIIESGHSRDVNSFLFDLLYLFYIKYISDITIKSLTAFSISTMGDVECCRRPQGIMVLTLMFEVC